MADEQKEVAEVFHPSEYVKDELRARGIGEERFIQVMDYDKDKVVAFLEGKSRTTKLLCKLIGDFFGTSSELWENLNDAYWDWKKLSNQ